MALIKKIIKIGNSKGITLPSAWLEFIDREAGFTVKELAIEVNGCLRVTSIPNKTEKHNREMR
jgi:antitoxin component of MazEF toxin-antitoxin module